MNKLTLQMPLADSCREKSRFFLWQSMLLILLLNSLLAFIEFYNKQMFFSVDGYGYLRYTQVALESGWEEAVNHYPDMKNYPPLLVIFMYGIGKLGLNYQLAALILNFLAIVFTSFGALLAGCRLYNDKLMALCTALMIACMPKIYNTGCDILRDPLYWAEFMWLIVLLLKLVDSSEKWSRGKLFACGTAFALLTALSIPTRKEGVFMNTICLILLSIFSPLSKKAKFAIVALSILLTTLVIVLIKANNVPWNILGSYKHVIESW